MQPQCAVERARVRHLARHPEVNLNLLTMGWHLKQKPWPSPSIFMYILLPLNGQVIVQQGSEGRKRRPQIYIRITLKSREGQPSNTNWPWLRRWAYQTIPLLIVFTIRTYICESLDKIVENTGPPAPTCRPLGHVKNIYKTRCEPSDPK
jgi:hypothetical protein